MASVYAVLYDKSGTFLMAKKQMKSYYTQAGGGKVNALGWTINSGPGEYALPGGKLEESNIEDGARREFLEETGFNLPLSPDNNPPKTVKFNVKGEALPPNATNYAFSAVYFCASEEDVENTWSNISEIALPNSRDIAGAIMRRNIKTYSEITLYARKHGIKEWPADNELKWVWRWSFSNKNDWANIESMKNNDNIGWYYCILEYLCFHILNRKA
ncbi:NUDIX hydrolase [Burkholderia cepacia]|uniref:NUDIX hydrolase n=1 Tax=Burkholderia cepacia TaxID=292 RepID=UPI0009BD9D31|nr:NUDIX hydrolase [Burkholderia cepacia]